MAAAPHDPDDTVRSPPSPKPLPAPRRRGTRVLGSVLLAGLLAVAAGSWWMLRPPAPLPVASVALALTPAPPANRLDGPAPLQPPATAIRVADEATILADEPAALTVFRFSLNPAVLVLDFATLAQQGRMLNRIAVLVEKADMPHDRVLDDAALDAAIRGGGNLPDTYYYGHDYRAADLRRFFMLADRDGVTLNADEAWLRALVRQVGWAEPSANGAIISVPRVGSDAMVDVAARAVILHHELSHGEYFTDAAYADYARHVWSATLSDKDRALFRAFLAADHYDTTNEDLMINETQAYMMHTRDARFFSAAALHMSQTHLDTLRTSFLADMPHGWLRDRTTGADAPIPVRAPRRRWRYGLATLRRKAVAATRPRRLAASTAL